MDVPQPSQGAQRAGPNDRCSIHEPFSGTDGVAAVPGFGDPTPARPRSRGRIVRWIEILGHLIEVVRSHRPEYVRRLPARPDDR